MTTIAETNALPAMAAVPAIDVRSVWTAYGTQVIHRDVSLSLPAGRMLALIGGSGSGKTTLLRAIVGLLSPVRGEVRLFGVPVLDPDPQVRRDIRRRFGMLFQQGALFSALSVYDNIAFPLRELQLLDEGLIADLVHQKLAMVELEPKHGGLMPAELSGGMVKRVALARALALEPELLVLDEPTAGLDPDRSQRFVQLIRGLQAGLGFSVIMVTHDLDTLFALADRVAVLAEQQLVAEGDLAAVMASPHPFISNFFATASQHRTVQGS